MNARQLLAILAGVLAVVSLIGVTTLPLIAIAVILLAVAMLI